MAELLTNLQLGFEVALSLQGLFYCLLGVTLGTVVGVLPGIGPMASISILLPLTFHTKPELAIIMLAGIYYGSAYGGSIAGILLNIPGTANTAVTCLDGYPMTKQGRAGVALFVTAIASFVGSMIGLIMLIGFAPVLARAALIFGPWEYFAAMVLGLIGASVMSSNGLLRALIAVALGLVLGFVGTDVQSGIQRFTFGNLQLIGGLSLIAVAMGFFGVPEVVANAPNAHSHKMLTGKVTLRSMLPTRDDVRRSWKSILRGSGVGIVLGILPGTGGLIASFMSYALEKRVSKNPERFGKGAIEGISAPEAANNAAIQAAFIPTLALGIPGDVLMALMLGALVIHGVTPGPTLVTNHPELFWGVTVSFFIGNVALLVLNVPLIGLWVSLLKIPYRSLFPAIVVFICVGVFSVSSSSFDVYLVAFFGVAGYSIAFLKIQPAPLLLGMVLGPMMEDELRRSLLLAHGDWTSFLTRPVSLSILLVTAAILVGFAVTNIRAQRRAALQNEAK